MKAFITSLCVFTVLLGLIIWNAAFIHRTANTLERCVEALSINQYDSFLELERYWKEKKTLMGLSVSTGMIQSIDERLAEMRAAILQKDETELAISSHLVLVAIERVRYNERFSIDNLL